jgi:hypothetical protein
MCKHIKYGNHFNEPEGIEEFSPEFYNLTYDHENPEKETPQTDETNLPDTGSTVLQKQEVA